MKEAYFPQTALTLGVKNTRAITIKLGMQEPVGRKTAMKVLPVLEDMRGTDARGTIISSMDIRKGLANFFRSSQGFNNRIPKKLTEATAEVKKNLTPTEPKWIWPEPNEMESLELSGETGWLNTVLH